MSVHWYNNGNVEKRLNTDKCPDGWIKGRLPRSQEWCLRNGLSHSGQKPWNAGLTKNDNPKLACSDSRKQLLSEYWLGKKKSEVHCKNISKAKTGCRLTDEVKLKISNTLSGRKLSEQELLQRNQKQFETKNKNKSFNSSKSELLYAELLYSNHINFESQFKNTLVYNFTSDFYLVDFQVYVELNFHPSHGAHPFDSTNIEDICIVNKWRDRQATYQNSAGNVRKNSYFKYEEVFTVKDPEKLKAVVQNKLNYVLVYPKCCYFYKDGKIIIKKECADFMYNTYIINTLIEDISYYYTQTWNGQLPDTYVSDGSGSIGSIIIGH